MATVRELLDGRLANTAFAVIAPDGRTRLTRGARSARQVFGQRSINEGLQGIAKRYPGRKLDEPALTPDFTSLREAVNVAACDERPLVLAWGEDAADLRALEKELRDLAWSPDFVGRLHWDLSIGDALRAFVPDAPTGERGVIVVQPEPYGRSAAVIGTIDLDLPITDQRTALKQAVARFHASFTKRPYEDHVRNGLRLDITWDEAVRMGERDDQKRRR